MIQIPPWELIKKYDRPGPRYTSYPTAPEWSDAFGPGEYEEHLARADAQARPALDLRPPPVLPRDVPVLRLQRHRDARSHARRVLPRAPREGGRARREAAAPPPHRHPAPLGRRHAHLPRREAARALPRAPRAALRLREGRREGDRDRPGDHDALADRDAREARLQPDLDGRAGLRRAGPGDRRPHPGREGDRRARAGGARQRLPRGEPRPHLRAALPVARHLAEDARPHPADPPGPPGGVRVRLRAVVEAAPAAAPAGGAAQARAARRAVPAGGARRSRRAATGSSASTTSRSSRTSSRARRTRATCTGTSRATRSARLPTPSRSG